MTATTIQLSKGLKQELDELKIFKDETYEEVIEGLIDERNFQKQLCKI